MGFFDRLSRLMRGDPQPVAGWDGTHRIVVHDVRPRANEESFDPYYIAMCDCGWFGDGKETEDEARTDALGHSPIVEDELFHPLG